MIIPRRRPNRTADFGPCRAVISPSVISAAGIIAAEKHQAPIGFVIGHGMAVSRRRLLIKLNQSPIGAVPLPSILQVRRSAALKSTEENRAPSHSIIGQRARVPLGRYVCRSFLLPIGSIKFPGILKKPRRPVAAKEHHPVSSGIVGHGVLNPGRRIAAGRNLCP